MVAGGGHHHDAMVGLLREHQLVLGVGLPMVGRHCPSRKWAAAGLRLGLGGPTHGLWASRFRAGNRKAPGGRIVLTLRLVAVMPVDAAFLGRWHPGVSRDNCLPALE